MSYRSAIRFATFRPTHANGGEPALHVPRPGPARPGPARPGHALSLAQPSAALSPQVSAGGPAVVPGSAGEALELVLAGLGYLAAADLASAPAPVQADCLRGLERAAAMQVAAQARALAAFCAQAGYEHDGHGSPRTWLTWQTRVTRPAASGALASMRRLKEHGEVAEALAAGTISSSWARQITDWTDKLPDEARRDADVILLSAAAGGAELADLAALAEEMRRRLARPDRDGDGFDDRSLRLGTTLGGAGKLHGDLTPQCTAALQAVLDALGKRAGPEDTRSTDQRHHDAMEEACRRLISSGCLPDRAGQPVQLQLTITLDELARGAAHGYDCDAAIAPVVTGNVDHALLDELAARLAGHSPDSPAIQAIRAPWTQYGGPPPAAEPTPNPCHDPRCPGPGCHHASAAQAAHLNWAAASELLLRNAIALLSGPSGLAAWLRDRDLTGPAASISLPLDVGAVTETIPPHLRRAVILRDKHCAAPGCDQPPAACHVHHIIPRSEGGATRLDNLILACTFHHLIAIHRWGWTIALNADGTTTMTSPDGRCYHSHSPGAAAA